MKWLVRQTKLHLDNIFQGGGKKAKEKQKERNKLSARAQIDYLVDDPESFLEIGAFGGFDMYEAEGGAWFPITGKKYLRMQEIAIENNLPFIYLVDSAGGVLFTMIVLINRLDLL